MSPVQSCSLLGKPICDIVPAALLSPRGASHKQRMDTLGHPPSSWYRGGGWILVRRRLSKKRVLLWVYLKIFLLISCRNGKSFPKRTLFMWFNIIISLGWSYFESQFNIFQKAVFCLQHFAFNYDYYYCSIFIFLLF